ncbi:MAG: hypothetical protein ACM3KE_00735, partial [Hyphomicrobiales bacterium]
MSMNRRNFIKGAMALSGLLTTTGCMTEGGKPKEWITGAPEPDSVEATKVVRTVCLGCHSNCGIQVKVKDGVVVKIDG